MKYKFLLFDLDNTLLDFDLAEDLALDKLFLKYGVKESDIAEYKDFYKPMNKELWQKLERGEITRESLINTRFYNLFSHFGLELDGSVLAKEYEAMLGECAEHIEGAVELLENLSRAGFELYAVSNGISNIQRKRLANSEITPFFKEIFISEEMGAQKPDIEYFEMVERKVEGFELSRALLIGDSLSADIQGANNFGIDCVWYNPFGKEHTGIPIPTFEFQNYKDLQTFLCH